MITLPMLSYRGLLSFMAAIDVSPWKGLERYGWKYLGKCSCVGLRLAMTILPLVETSSIVCKCLPYPRWKTCSPRKSISGIIQLILIRPSQK